MERKFLIRYLTLIGILVVCAGIVWIARSASEQSHENAVLAWQDDVDIQSQIPGDEGVSLPEYERMNIRGCEAVI